MDGAAPKPDVSRRPNYEEAVLAEIKAALEEIDYGSIVITIHQGKVVGLETSRKRRLNP
jgi:hypothetical protein